MVSTINATSASGIVATADNSTTLALQTNGTNALYIDASQNVGIGTTGPSQKLSLGSGSSNVALQMTFNTATGATVVGLQSDNSFIINQQIGQPLIFNTSNAERMRIDSSGNLLVGKTTTAETTSGVCFSASVNNIGLSSGNYFIVNYVPGGASTMIDFRTGGVSKGSISQNGSNVAYNTSSDYRLKENVTLMTNGLATVSALKPVTYDWVGDKLRGEGFIAHELQEIIPLAVTGEKDAIDEEGNIKPQGVDYSKIVVHLVAAIQELKATVDAQATEIAALKAKVGA